MIKEYDIICVSTSDWDKPWGSKQQLMLRLSAGNNRVLYVEYQASLLQLFSLPILFSQIKKLKKRTRKINENLIIYTPFPYLPFGYYIRSLNRINQTILSWFLSIVLKKNRFINPILWIYSPCAIDLLDSIDKKLIVYHCIADFSNEKKSYMRSKTISLMEKELIEKSDIVLTSVEKLQKEHAKINSNTFLFPSAVDVKAFLQFLGNGIDEPKDIACLKRPRIGVVGYLDGSVIDVDLLHFVACKHPEWYIVLIGPRFRHTKRLDSLAKESNIYFIPEKKNVDIPSYINSLDVGIIPYMVNEFTNNVSSLKLYEYLALGKPVVSTNLAEFKRFEGIIKIAKNKEEFIENIALSLSEKDNQLMHDRIEFAKNNSWEERLSAASKLITEALRAKKTGSAK